MTPRVPRGEGLEEPRPPFTFAFAAMLTLLTSVLYMAVLVQFSLALQGSVGVDDIRFQPALHAVALILAFANAFAMAVRRGPEPSPESFGLLPPRPRAWLASALLLPSLLLISEADNWLRQLIPVLSLTPAAGPRPPVDAFALAANLLSLAVVEPMAIETFFRGLCHAQLAAMWGSLRTVFASTLLSSSFVMLTFAIPLASVTPSGLPPGEHWFSAAMLQYGLRCFSQTLVLATVRQASGSLYPPVLLASLFAVTTELSQRNAFGIPGFDDMNAGTHTPAAWLLPALGLTATGLALCYRLRRSA